MRYIILALTILGAFVPESWSAQTAFYSCKNRHLIFKLELTAPEALYDVYAENFAPTCGVVTGPGPVTLTAGTPNVYLMDLDLTAYTGAIEAICGAAGADGNNAVVNFVTQGLANMFESTDLRYTITCDFTQPDFELTALDLSAGAPITGNPGTAVATVLTEAVILELMDDSVPPVQIVAAILGQQVSLQATLTPSATALGMRITDCIAQRTAVDNTAVVNLIADTGCVDIAGPLFDTTSEFAGDAVDGAVATTVPFGMFKFTDVDTIYIQCSVWFCTAAADAGCSATHCGAVPTGRRRRRQVQSQSQNITYTGLTIRVVDSADKLNAGQNGGAGSSSCDNEAKTYTLTFGAIIGILSFLLLLGLALVIFLFMRIRRRDDIDEKIHHPVVMTVKQ